MGVQRQRRGSMEGRARQGAELGARKVGAGRQGDLWGWGGAVSGEFPVLTPFNTSSRWSRNCINRLIFQLVLQFTELTCGSAQRPVRPGRPPAAGEWACA